MAPTIALSAQPPAQAPVQWRPNLPEGGDYAVEVWYPQGTNRAPDSPFTVHHANGSTAVPVNQQVNGGAWFTLGTYPFFTGTSGYVRLANNASTGFVVLADAVRFRQVTSAPAAPAPTGLVATAVNSTDIDFDWNWSAYADGYWVDIAESAADLTGATGTFQNTFVGRVNTWLWQGLTPARLTTGACGRTTWRAATTATRRRPRLRCPRARHRGADRAGGHDLERHIRTVQPDAGRQHRRRVAGHCRD